jgi:hypothetical protein
MYFDSRNFEEPHVIDTVREWVVVNRTASDGPAAVVAGAAVPCFVVPGDPGYCYVYRRSNLKYILTLYSGKPRLARYVGPPLKSPELDRQTINHGDHVTFGFIKNTENLRVRTHKTIYSEQSEPPGSFLASRSSECNFDIPPTGFASGSAADPVCYNNVGVKTGQVLTQVYSYDPLVVDMIRSLGKVITGVPLEPPEAPVPPPEPVGPVTVGTRGGRYRVTSSGGRRYIRRRQTGGATVSYKDITFFNEKFAKFLADRIIRHVRAARPDLEAVRVFFDEGNYFGPGSNKYIVLAYDFSAERCNLFYVNAEKAMAACYAEKIPEPERTPYERSCLRDFLSATRPERLRPREVNIGGATVRRRPSVRQPAPATA